MTKNKKKTIEERLSALEELPSKLFVLKSNLALMIESLIQTQGKTAQLMACVFNGNLRSRLEALESKSAPQEQEVINEHNTLLFHIITNGKYEGWTNEQLGKEVRKVSEALLCSASVIESKSAPASEPIYTEPLKAHCTKCDEIFVPNSPNDHKCRVTLQKQLYGAWKLRQNKEDRVPPSSEPKQEHCMICDRCKSEMCYIIQYGRIATNKNRFYHCEKCQLEWLVDDC